MKTFPPLRPDLVIKKQTISQAESYIIKDPQKQAYYKYDPEEYFVLSQMNGERTADEIAVLYNQKFNDELTGKDIAEFIGSIRRLDIQERTDIQQNIFLYEQLIAQRKNRIQLAKGSPLYFRIPVVDPNNFFDKVMPFIKWIWSTQFVYLMILFMFSAVGLLFANYGIFKIHMASVFDFMNMDLSSILTLWITVASVIAIHELGHGMTCKRFGGECHEIGFLFMFFTPCMYANVNDAWMFEDKRHRLFVTFAGCFIEFFVGSIAVYVWLFTQQGAFLNLIAFKIVVVCFFSAIFMNFNPLMRFDGYFALSDFVEVPNLRTLSREYVKYLFQTKVFRLKREFDILTKREQWILGTYGVLSTLYLTNVMIGLMFMIGGALITNFKAMGVIITGVIIYKFFGKMVEKLINFMRLVMTEHENLFKKKIVRAAISIVLIIIIFVLILYPFPYRFEITSNLEASTEVVIRSLASGYVKPLDKHARIFNKGDILIELDNPDLISKLKLNDIDVKSITVELQGASAADNSAEILKLKKRKQKLDEDRIDIERQQTNLTIYAPFKGALLSDLYEIENTFISEGDEIGRYIDNSVYQAVLEIPEKDLEGINEGMSATLVLDVRPWELFKGKVMQISPLNIQKGAVRYYKVIVEFPNEDESLRLGLKGNIMINIGNFTVPKRILRWFRKTIKLDLQM